jgi:tetratricopeptide (TPR) repeat protein
MTVNLDKYKEDFATFIELGFVAVKYASEEMALSLFTAAQALDPESSASEMGLAYVALNKLELDKAKKMYEGIIEKEPENHMAQMFLGICYVLDKNNLEKGEKLIKEALDKVEEPSVRHLGETSLQWIDKEFKQKKGMIS